MFAIFKWCSCPYLDYTEHWDGLKDHKGLKQNFRYNLKKVNKFGRPLGSLSSLFADLDTLFPYIFRVEKQKNIFYVNQTK